MCGAVNSKKAVFKVVIYCKVCLFIFNSYLFKNTSFSCCVFDNCLVGFSGLSRVKLYLYVKKHITFYVYKNRNQGKREKATALWSLLQISAWKVSEF